MCNFLQEFCCLICLFFFLHFRYSVSVSWCGFTHKEVKRLFDRRASAIYEDMGWEGATEFSMVDFVKGWLLGTFNEFRNRFVNPISGNGQHLDSTDRDVRIMRKLVGSYSRPGEKLTSSRFPIET